MYLEHLESIYTNSITSVTEKDAFSEVERFMVEWDYQIYNVFNCLFSNINQVNKNISELHGNKRL